MADEIIQINTPVLWSSTNRGISGDDSKTTQTFSGKIVAPDPSDTLSDAHSKGCSPGSALVEQGYHPGFKFIRTHYLCVPTRHLYPLTPGKSVFYSYAPKKDTGRIEKISPRISGKVVDEKCADGKVAVKLNTKVEKTSNQYECLQGYQLEPGKKLPIWNK